MGDEIDDTFSGQPLPTGDGEVVLFPALAALRARADHGLQKYGMYLRTDNGRDALVDAAEEMMDGYMYLCQAIIERDGHLPKRWFE